MRLSIYLLLTALTALLSPAEAKQKKVKRYPAEAKQHTQTKQPKIMRFQSAHDQDVLNFIKGFLPENPVIVEAGSYDGSDSARLARFWPKGHLYAFEPVPELFQKVKQSTYSFPNVKAYQKALSDTTGHAEFHLSVLDTKPQDVFMSSSLLPPKVHLEKASNVLFPRAIDVETTSLDDWARQEGVDHVDFFWLDMQGYELNMLKVSEIAKKARVIWLEVEFVEAYKGQYLFDDIRSWMEANGFEIAAADFNLDHPHAWFGDAMFVRRGH